MLSFWIVCGDFSYVTRQLWTINTNRCQWNQLSQISICRCHVKNNKLLSQPKSCSLGKKLEQWWFRSYWQAFPQGIGNCVLISCLWIKCNFRNCVHRTIVHDKKPTPCSVHWNKLIVAQVVKKFSTFFGISSFIHCVVGWFSIWIFNFHFY